MALTKAQKELLLILRDKPEYHIYNSTYEAPRLLDQDGNKVRTITTPLFEAIHPWLKRHPEQLKCFIFDPQAEISAEWPAKKAELNRQRREMEEQTKAEKVKAESDRASAWFETTGPYTVVIQGKWPYSGDIMLGDEYIAEINPRKYSTKDENFDDVLRYPENTPHFNQIKSLIRQANAYPELLMIAQILASLEDDGGGIRMPTRDEIEAARAAIAKAGQ